MITLKYPIFVSFGALALLAGCGEAEKPKAAAPPAERGIYISASDCADGGKLSAEQCGQAIDQAVAAFPEAEAIFEANIETMQRLGLQGWKDLNVDKTA